MKIRSFFIITLIVMIGLTACAPKSTTQPSASEPPAATQAPQAVTQANGSSDGGSTAATATTDVDALIREKLQNHHGIDRIYNAHHTREEWNATLDRMIGYGAKINEEEKQTIIDYLMSKQQ